jgi:hypothetical protein
MAGGAELPTCIFSSKNVAVYGYITNDGTDLDLLREIGKEATAFSVDGVKSSWTNWEADIKRRLTTTVPK